MLQLKNIRKKYNTGGYEQIALDDVSLNLRDNEFVAILGPSGSGKTTLLNIIGGLDRYDTGDLIINGVSTKKYKDRDWDSYRNHSVGFVFQSYNLIPHQTVLQNVELALTIGGVSADKRRKMALDALEKVGLREQSHKKPNQMSGGQMQRVAIARALVNDPKILLADEPTGALDTKTSVQVMDLLKEVANDRLVVMVTHNPELAEQYANRIVRLKDGQITDDSNPLQIESEEPAVHKNLGKASMSLATSFGLSLNNLMTKKGRTFLTSFAGSIGIIGIALILALSTGFQNYINQIQEETMNSYPLTINAEAGDLASTILSMQANRELKAEGNYLVEQQYITSFTDSITNNDLKSFMDYLDAHPEEYQDDVRMIKYLYSVTPVIYTIDATDTLTQIHPSASQNQQQSMMTSLMANSGGGMSTFSEMIEPDRMRNEYTIAYGKWPEKYNELAISVQDPNQISDLLLYSLGFRSVKELQDIMKDLYMGEEITVHNEPMTISYDELLGKELKLIDPSLKYKYNEEYEIYEDMSKDDDYMMDVYENAEPLKITAIIYKPREKGSGSSSTTGVLYLPSLTKYVMEKSASSEIVQAQLRDPDYDVFSGKSFDEEDDEDELNFEDMITIDEDLLAEAFVVNMDMDGLNFDQEAMTQIIMDSSKAVVENIDEVTQTMVKAVTEADSAFANGVIEGYKQIATITVNNSTAPETKPDVSVVVGLLQSQKDTVKEQAKEAARPQVTQAVDAIIARLTGSLAGVRTRGEAEAIIDLLGLDEETAKMLKSTIVEAEGENSGAGITNTETAAVVEPGSIDTSATIAAIQGMRETLIEQSLEQAGELATQSMNETIEKLENASNKAEADAVIDGIEGIEDSQKVLLKSQITKQFEEGGETSSTQYITLSYLDMYKENAINEEKIGEMLGSIDQISLDPVVATKVIGDAFDNYYGSLTPDENNLVPVADLPPTDAAIMKAITDNSSAIFEEGYNLAKEYMALLVAQGTGQALGEVMAPLTDLFSGGEDLLTIDTDKFAEAFQFNKDEDELSRIMETMLGNEDKSYKGNLVKLGYQNEDDPTGISFYFNDFESKNRFTDFLERYNDNAAEEQKLQYTDITGILMGSVETIVNAVTYVLIAFVSISLVEIGILRAIGASKRNISSIFNAETFIIGMLSGVIGVVVTRLLLFPINDIIHKVTEIDDITAVLGLPAALVLVAIATVLTMIGGLIPSRSASKKDPVIALRTE